MKRRESPWTFTVDCSKKQGELSGANAPWCFVTAEISLPASEKMLLIASLDPGWIETASTAIHKPSLASQSFREHIAGHARHYMNGDKAVYGGGISQISVDSRNSSQCVEELHGSECVEPVGLVPQRSPEMALPTQMVWFLCLPGTEAVRNREKL